MHKEFTITATGPAGSSSAVLLVLCDTAPLPELVATYYHADDDDAPCKSGLADGGVAHGTASRSGWSTTSRTR